MESEFSGQVARAVERLATEVEELGRRQKAFEGLMERVLAEQAELRREQEELRQRQEAQSQEWGQFGLRWSAYSAAWEARLSGQVQQFEGFTRQLVAWEARLNAQMQALEGLTRQFTDLLPPED